MNVNIANRWLDALIAALKADADHATALAALVSQHNGKRTPLLMEQLQAGFKVLYPTTPSEIRVWAGMPTVVFPQDSAARKCWGSKIAPHLPKLRASTSKASKKGAVDPVAAQAKRLRKQFTKAQLTRLIAELLK